MFYCSAWFAVRLVSLDLRQLELCGRSVSPYLRESVCWRWLRVGLVVGWLRRWFREPSAGDGTTLRQYLFACGDILFLKPVCAGLRVMGFETVGGIKAL